MLTKKVKCFTNTVLGKQSISMDFVRPRGRQCEDLRAKG